MLTLIVIDHSSTASLGVRIRSTDKGDSERNTIANIKVIPFVSVNWNEIDFNSFMFFQNNSKINIWCSNLLST